MDRMHFKGDKWGTSIPSKLTAPYHGRGTASLAQLIFCCGIKVEVYGKCSFHQYFKGGIDMDACSGFTYYCRNQYALAGRPGLTSTMPWQLHRTLQHWQHVLVLLPDSITSHATSTPTQYHNCTTFTCSSSSMHLNHIIMHVPHPLAVAQGSAVFINCCKQLNPHLWLLPNEANMVRVALKASMLQITDIFIALLSGSHSPI